jgi:hypothetical protein
MTPLSEVVVGLDEPVLLEPPELHAAVNTIIMHTRATRKAHFFCLDMLQYLPFQFNRFNLQNAQYAPRNPEFTDFSVAIACNE